MSLAIFSQMGCNRQPAVFQKPLGMLPIKIRIWIETQQRFGISLGYSMLQLLNMGMRQTKMRQWHWQIDHGHSGHAIEEQCSAGQ